MIRGFSLALVLLAAVLVVSAESTECGTENCQPEVYHNMVATPPAGVTYVQAINTETKVVGDEIRPYLPGENQLLHPSQV